MSPTSTDWSPQLQEALWEVGTTFGLRLEASQQVAVARLVAQRPVSTASPEDVRSAFASVGLRQPSLAFAKAVLESVQRTTTSPTLLGVLLDYRDFAVRALSAQFGGRTRGHEEELRNNILTYLPAHGYTEARSGRGRTDIRIPPPEDAIIEVKVWTNASTYRDGVVELGRYIYTEHPKQAFMVVFGEREPLPPLIASPRQVLAATETVEGMKVPVVVVPFEVDAPSKAAALERRRQRGSR
ncbi:MAG TPA: hypothetical protein VF533_05570 [Solirubrobacteraceae bacterium]|jgi:hypothetical protein